MNAGRVVIVSDQVGCGPDLIKSAKTVTFLKPDAKSLEKSVA